GRLCFVVFVAIRPAPSATLFPYTTLFRSVVPAVILTPGPFCESQNPIIMMADPPGGAWSGDVLEDGSLFHTGPGFYEAIYYYKRSEEHTSELQSRENLVCRLLL